MAVIKDVAREAGVSPTTVSRFLNGGKYVKAEIQERIQAAIDKLNYTPSHIARSLVRQSTKMIGVIVPDIQSNYHSTLLSFIEATASRCGYSILMCNIAEDTGKEQAYIEFLKNMPVDGIVILHEELNDETAALLNSTSIPIVFAGVRPTKGQFISVCIDDYKAAYDGVSFLADAGHRGIALLGGNMKDHTSGKERLKGYQDALEARGLALENRRMILGGYSARAGYRLGLELLELQDPEITAVFCMSDSVAVGCLNAFIDNGIRVPEDISLLGFDGIDIVEQVRPRLSTVSQPLDEIGNMSVELLVDAIEKREKYPKVFELILRHHLKLQDSIAKR